MTKKEKAARPGGGEAASKTTSGIAIIQQFPRAWQTGSDDSLLVKWWGIFHAGKRHRLSGGDLLVYWQLADRFNPATGTCWPSLTRLAADTGLSIRGVKDSIERLAKCGCIDIVERGNRVRSNRYRPNFFAELGNPNSLPEVGNSASLPAVGNSASLHDAEVGNSSAGGREVLRMDVGNSTSLEPTHEPEQKAKGEVGGGGSIEPPAPAVGLGPRGPASLGATGDRYRYPEFWAVYPKRRGVFETEEAITQALADGVTIEAILAGARAYAAFVQSQRWDDKDKYTKHPKNFITGRHWLDDWSVKPKKEPGTEKTGAKPDKQAASGKKTTTKTGRPKRKMNPDYRAWEHIWKPAEEKAVRESALIREHFGKCTHCKAVMTDKSIPSDSKFERLCDEGKRLVNAERDADKAALAARGRAGKPPERFVYVE